MSVQLFLQGKLLGVEEYLQHPGVASAESAGSEALLRGRCQWVALLGEVLPRALLAELGLARLLLGCSGGGQFLLVLPSESRDQAEAFLQAASADMGELSGGSLRLLWAFTENLGDWSDVRKRLTEELTRKRAAPAAGCGTEWFSPQPERAVKQDSGLYFANLSGGLREARTVGWNPETPGRVLLDEGKHSWPLRDSAEAILLARHEALDDDGHGAASVSELAARSEGQPGWGVLRGDVDRFGIRLRRLQTIEEHVGISLTYKQFFAGELEVLCSLPGFWRRVTVLYSGGDDFAVYGSWDALLLLAREIQRLFHRLTEENLKELPGAEGKTISMALALAPEMDTPIAQVFDTAGRQLEAAKAGDKDCFHVFGQTVEWRHLTQAAELRDIMNRLVRECGCSPQFLRELLRYYKDAVQLPPHARGDRFSRPWRFHRRLNLSYGGTRDREFQRLRANLIGELIGKNAALARLRPAGHIALEWARRLTEA